MANLAFEAKRKLIHVLGISYILGYWIFLKLFSHTIAMLVLLSAFITFIVIEYFRINEHKKIPIIHVLWREKEENSLGGQVYYILGIIIALAILLAIFLYLINSDINSRYKLWGSSVFFN